MARCCDGVLLASCAALESVVPMFPIVIVIVKCGGENVPGNKGCMALLGK